MQLSTVLVALATCLAAPYGYYDPAPRYENYRSTHRYHARENQPIVLNNYIPVTVTNENTNANANQLGGSGDNSMQKPLIDGSISFHMF